MPAIPATLATVGFLGFCRTVLSERTKSYIQDRSKVTFMTLDFTDRKCKHPMIKMSAQSFKNEFSRCSSLIKDGFSFELKLRGVSERIYARRYGNYIDPLDNVLDQWRKDVEELAWHQNQAKILSAIDKSRMEHFQDHDIVMTELKAITKGMLRIGNGSKPFVEGDIPRT